MASVLRGKINIVKHLLALGADTSIGEQQGYTPPHGAAFQGRPDVMKALIDAGLDVNEYHSDGYVPLHRVCWGSEQVSSSIQHITSQHLLVRLDTDIFNIEHNSFSVMLKHWKYFWSMAFLLISKVKMDKLAKIWHVHQSCKNILILIM